MTIYRIYYCTENRKRFAAHDVDATNDSGAMERVHKLGARNATYYVEVWEGERHVYRGRPEGGELSPGTTSDSPLAGAGLDKGFRNKANKSMRLWERLEE